MSGELNIYGAAYGPEEVSGKIREFRKDNKISIIANNETFGDTWKGEKKSLIVVFKYDNPQCSVETAIVQEGGSLEISPPPNLTRLQKDRRTTTSLEKIGETTSRHVLTTRTSTSESKIILGAAYGLSDVTDKATSLVTPQGAFTQKASNDVWGDGWKGNKKTLVIVYTYDGIYMVNAVTEGETMQFIVSPALSILGAAYGLKNVTDLTLELVKNRSFNIIANNETFGDGWKGEVKTLITVYQYGEEEPMVGIVRENYLMYWIYSSRNKYFGSTDPTTLTILGAAYGPVEVTSTVQGHVKNNNSLEITASNDTFGDTWPDKKKSLVVVYRYGRNLPQTQVVAEHGQMTIAINTMRDYKGIISTNNMLENGEKILLSGINNKYIECDQNERLVANSNTADSGLIFQVFKDSPDGKIILKTSEGKFVTVGQDDCLYVGNDFENATKFEISISVKGGIRLSVPKGMYVRIDPSNSNLLKADSVDNFGALTIFEISMQISEQDWTESFLELEEISDCDLAWASFIWKLSGGFFLAIGLGPFILTGKVKTGVLSLIRSSPRAWAAVQKLVKVIVTGAKNNIKLAVAGCLGVISTFYYEGLLWTIFKMMLNFGAWYAVGWALAKIIEIVLIPEVEAAELLASFTVWAIQLIQSGLEVGQTCQ